MPNNITLITLLQLYNFKPKINTFFSQKICGPVVFLPTEAARRRLPRRRSADTLAGAPGQVAMGESLSLRSCGPCGRSGPGFQQWCSRTAWRWNRCLCQWPPREQRTYRLRRSAKFIQNHQLSMGEWKKVIPGWLNINIQLKTAHVVIFVANLKGLINKMISVDAFLPHWRWRCSLWGFQ